MYKERKHSVIPWIIRILAIAMIISIEFKKCQNENNIKQQTVITNQKTR